MNGSTCKPLLCLVLLQFCLSQAPVSIEFQSDPVLVQTGTDIVFTLVTLPDVQLVTWGYPEGRTPLALWTPGAVEIDPVPQYLGRVTLTRTQLRINTAQLADAGSYKVEVSPTSSTGLATNSGSVQLQVFGKEVGVGVGAGGGVRLWGVCGRRGAVGKRGWMLELVNR